MDSTWEPLSTNRPSQSGLQARLGLHLDLQTTLQAPLGLPPSQSWSPNGFQVGLPQCHRPAETCVSLRKTALFAWSRLSLSNLLLDYFFIGQTGLPSATWGQVGPPSCPPSVTWTPFGASSWPPSAIWSPLGRCSAPLGPRKLAFKRDLDSSWPFKLPSRRLLASLQANLGVHMASSWPSALLQTCFAGWPPNLSWLAS